MVLVRGAVDETHLRLVRDLKLRSAMLVPLVARGVTLGVITMVIRLATLCALLFLTLRPAPASERAHDAAVTA